MPILIVAVLGSLVILFCGHNVNAAWVKELSYVMVGIISIFGLLRMTARKESNSRSASRRPPQSLEQMMRDRMPED